ncbi:MAG: DUF192 domain-containing protein [Sulfitobacter sp.]
MTVILIWSGAAAQAQEACRADSVQLRGDWGQARFTVELAETPEEQRTGLMNRPSMPASAGMLFVYDQPQTLSFWMRNTLIPLDMVFIDAHGVVQNIHHSAIPLDETSIFGGNDLLAVLEINGGLAKRMGITVGSVLRHPLIPSDLAAWPC